MLKCFAPGLLRKSTPHETLIAYLALSKVCRIYFPTGEHKNAMSGPPRRGEYFRRVLDSIQQANAKKRGAFQFSVGGLLLAITFTSLIIGCLKVLFYAY